MNSDAILLGEDQRYLSSGFVITEHRIEAARYADSLTFLPGNIPATEHIRRLLDSNQSFVAAYCDLNHFKPFNDQVEG